MSALARWATAVSQPPKRMLDFMAEPSIG